MCFLVDKMCGAILEMSGLTFILLFFYMSYPFRKLDIVALHDVLCCVDTIQYFLLSLQNTAMHLLELKVIFWFPLTRLHSVCPVSIKFSRISFLICSGINIIYLILILNMNSLFASIFYKTSTFLRFHYILSVLV